MVKDKKNPEENEEETTQQEKAPAKKPAAKKETAKPRLRDRVKGWWKRNWKVVVAAGGGVVAGATGTYGVGKWEESRANKRSASYQQDYNND